VSKPTLLGNMPAARLRQRTVILVVTALCLLLVEAIVQARSGGIFAGATLATTDGQQIFEKICQGCHMPDAGGAVGAGHYPALAKNRLLSSRQYMALTILQGRANMPAFGAKHAIGFVGPPLTLSETQIAAVVNYVRTHFGNHYKDPLTAAEVTALDQRPPPPAH
jgi:mono/diheme cytochrome c family protein